MTAWNQAKMKYSRARSFGGLIIRAGGIVANVLKRLARTPGGGSKVMIRPARSRLTGSLGVISQVKKSLQEKERNISDYTRFTISTDSIIHTLKVRISESVSVVWIAYL